ncbi:MAG: hypothetical protein U0163_06160 [Gemmatimonadaceae bacterium]
MRPRTEVALALGVFGLAMVAVALIARVRRPAVDRDYRTSSLLAGPAGARGLADALTRAGVRVERLRDRALVSHPPRGEAVPAALLIVAPIKYFTTMELASVMHRAVAADGEALILSQVNGPVLARCLGLGVSFDVIDSAGIGEPNHAPWKRPAWIRQVFEPATVDTVPATSSAGLDTFDPCSALPRLQPTSGVRRDTLLVDTKGRAVMVRLRGGPFTHDVILVSDPRLFRNQTLRDTDAGPFLLGFLSSQFGRVSFDEYHQGFGPSGSLGSATLAWSTTSPLGWAIWQVAVAGLLALLVAAVRFGPRRALPTPSRRSPHEHVRALATALAAARGHQVAVGKLVMGLRRRLAHGARLAPERWRPWLQTFATQATRADTRAAAERLLSLTTDTVEPERVLQVAQAVEDVWSTMRR